MSTLLDNLIATIITTTTTTTLLESASPARICQLFYVLSAAAVLCVAAAPASAKRKLTQYGARGSTTTTTTTTTITSSSFKSSSDLPGKTTTAAVAADDEDDDDDDDDDDVDSVFTKLAGRLTSVGRVPHSWFVHFYVVSVCCSAFWAAQYLSRGRIMDAIVGYQAARADSSSSSSSSFSLFSSSSSSASMTTEQVLLAWFLMSIQGGRRLYENLTIIKPSSSRMWIVHWLLGNAFYVCTSVAVWVEGSGSLMYANRNLHMSTPSTKEALGVVLFITASLMQYGCHRYLAGLKKYSLPEGGLFRYLVCPHYTCECLLYLALAVVAAPKGQLYNRTLICAVLFVAVNLGVTASGTKSWYSDKFGRQKVQGRWNMIPYAF